MRRARPVVQHPLSTERAGRRFEGWYKLDQDSLVVGFGANRDCTWGGPHAERLAQQLFEQLVDCRLARDSHRS